MVPASYNSPHGRTKQPKLISGTAGRGIARRTAPPRALVLRFGRAGDLRRRLRCADERTQAHRGRASRAGYGRLAHPARGRQAGRGLPEGSRTRGPCSAWTTAYSAEELAAWDTRVRELAGGLPVEYVAEYKMDGLSVALRYEPTADGGAQLTDRNHPRRRPDRRGCDFQHPHHSQRAAHHFRRQAAKLPACRRHSKCAAKR